MLKIGSLFSGIGGIEKGLEDSGLGKTIWQCEIDPVCKEILAKHWPGVPIYDDITELRNPGYADIICAGFPCQDLSTANTRTRAGLDGEKSGLYRELIRVVSEVRPRVVVVENTGRNWQAWVPVVRGDLYRLGYSSVPIRLSPAQLGFPHHRDRVFLVAYAHSESESLRTLHEKVACILASTGRPKGFQRDAVPKPIRMANGIPKELDRVKVLGNSVCPQVSETLGLAIKDSLCLE